MVYPSDYIIVFYFYIIILFLHRETPFQTHSIKSKDKMAMLTLADPVVSSHHIKLMVIRDSDLWNYAMLLSQLIVDVDYSCQIMDNDVSNKPIIANEIYQNTHNIRYTRTSFNV